MKSTAKGYTLLEMLISMTLIGLLMAALVMGIHVGNKAWAKGEAKLRQVHTAEERAQFIFQQVASLVPYKVTSSNPDMPGDFYILEASAVRLRFLSTYGTQYRRHAGLIWDEYVIARNPRGDYSLVLRETPVRDDSALLPLLIERRSSDPDTGKTELIYRPFVLRQTDLRLMTGLQAARFEYFGAPGAGKQALWASTWEPRTEAPYPEAARFVWWQGGQPDQLVIPVRVRGTPK